MTTIEKINEIMCYDAFDGESPEDVFTRCSNNLNALPSPDIIDKHVNLIYDLINNVWDKN